MDKHDLYLLNGHRSMFGMVFLGVMSWFEPQNIDTTLKVITAIGAFISACFATRYYWYATLEKKKTLKEIADRKKNENISK